MVAVLSCSLLCNHVKWQQANRRTRELLSTVVCRTLFSTSASESYWTDGKMRLCCATAAPTADTGTIDEWACMPMFCAETNSATPHASACFLRPVSSYILFLLSRTTCSVACLLAGSWPPPKEFWGNGMGMGTHGKWPKFNDSLTIRECHSPNPTRSCSAYPALSPASSTTWSLTSSRVACHGACRVVSPCAYSACSAHGTFCTSHVQHGPGCPPVNNIDGWPDYGAPARRRSINAATGCQTNSAVSGFKDSEARARGRCSRRCAHVVQQEGQKKSTRSNFIPPVSQLFSRSEVCACLRCFDWCCFYYFLRNSLVALLEALFARIINGYQSAAGSIFLRTASTEPDRSGGYVPVFSFV